MPQTIGSYRIISVLGRGGMGVVYEAEQQSPRRPVALKVIRGERYVDAPYLRLFQREAQTLARLRHPGIASIYESGCTEDGHHFFAMELVRGEPLHIYVRRTELNRLDRLRLFRQVCGAINYAHQRGVIHRDLKPSNIVVTPEGKPKVLDFGLARITDTDVAAATLVTEVGKIQGTLSYMSPEQARGNPDEIDLRSDVYSLGVILYQLLTERLPHDFAASALHDAVRVLCDVTPVRPGTIDRTLCGDLETIVLMALAKQPHERYQSAAALADDVARFEGNQPILARPPSLMYLFRKLVSRHKVGAFFVMTLVATIVGFALWMSVLYREASVLRLEAEAEAESQKRLSSFVVGIFGASDPNVSQGAQSTDRELLSRGLEEIRSIAEDMPLVAATIMGTMAETYRNLGDHDTAVALRMDALTHRRRILGEDHPAVTESIFELGWALKQQGDLGAAERYFGQALAAQMEQGNDRARRRTLLFRGATLRDNGRYREARSVVQKAVALFEGLDGDHRKELSEALETLARVDLLLGRLSESERLFRRALNLRRAALGENHSYMASGWEELALTLQAMGRYADAEKATREAVRIRSKTHGEDHPYRANLLGQLGALRRDQGDLDGAETLLSEAVDVASRNEQTNPTLLARLEIEYALVLIAKGAYGQADRTLGAANEHMVARLRPEHPRLADLRLAMALLAAARGGHSSAARHADDARTLLLREIPAESWSVGLSENLLGVARANAGCTERAISLARQGFETMKAVRGPADVYVREAATRLATVEARCADQAP